MRVVLAMGAIVLGGLLLAAPALAAQQGYLISIAGRVVSADRHRGTIVLEHGILETMNAGSITCEVPRASLPLVRPGTIIMATADTRHRPWRLIDVQSFRTTREQRPPGRRVLADDASS